MGAACGRRTVLAGVQDDYRAVSYEGELRRRPGRSDRYLPPEAGPCSRSAEFLARARRRLEPLGWPG
jgi:hypothetical protein